MTWDGRAESNLRHVIEERNADADLLALAAGGRHLDVHVERSISGQLLRLLDQSESEFGADAEGGYHPVRWDLRNLYVEDELAVRTDVDVFPQPGILVHPQQPVNPRQSVVHQIHPVRVGASAFIRPVGAVEDAVTTTLRAVAASGHARAQSQRGVAGIRPPDDAGVGEHHQSGVFERPVSVDTQRR